MPCISAMRHGARALLLLKLLLLFRLSCHADPISEAILGKATDFLKNKTDWRIYVGAGLNDSQSHSRKSTQSSEVASTDEATMAVRINTSVRKDARDHMDSGRLSEGSLKPAAISIKGSERTERNDTTVGESLLRGLQLPITPSVLSNGSMAKTRRSPVSVYLDSFQSWLQQSHHQGMIIAIVILTGAFCAWNGPGLWRALFIVSGAAAASAVARFEVAGSGLISNEGAEMLFLVQVAGVVAYALHSGFEGSQVLLGALVGFIGAYDCGEWARNLDTTMSYGPGVAIFWYLAGMVCGVLVCTSWRKSALALLGPLLGGFLIASGLGSGCSRIYEAVHKGDDYEIDGVFLPLPSPDSPWVNVAAALLNPLHGGALVAHSCCAAVAMLLHRFGGGRRLFSILCLVSCVLLSALAALHTFLREKKDSASSAAMQKEEWCIFGCILWALLTSASAWRQLKTSMLSSGLVLRASSSALEEPMVQAPEGGFIPIPPNSPEAAYFTNQQGQASLSQWLTARRSFDLAQKTDHESV